jgi:hypothetical protein
MVGYTRTLFAGRCWPSRSTGGSQVIPEGAGPVKPFRLVGLCRLRTLGSVLGAPGRAAEALTPTSPGAGWLMPRTMLVEFLGLSLRLLVVSVSRAGVPAGAGPPGTASHPFAWQGMERLDTAG